VTPLVDVMLVLLIIFMVTAPLLVAGVPIDLPESRAGALDQKATPVQIAMTWPLPTQRYLGRWPTSPPSRSHPRAVASISAPTALSTMAGSCA